MLLLFGSRVGLVGLRTLPSASLSAPFLVTPPPVSSLHLPLPGFGFAFLPVSFRRGQPGQIRFALVRLPPRRAGLGLERGLLKPSRNGDVGAKEGGAWCWFLRRSIPSGSRFALFLPPQLFLRLVDWLAGSTPAPRIRGNLIRPSGGRDWILGLGAGARGAI